MTKRYVDEETGNRVDVTAAALRIIDTLPGEDFLEELYWFMWKIAADYAYVGAQGQNLRINLVWPPQSRIEERRGV